MFRFTIRDVLWLTVVVGMGVGWWIQVAKDRAVTRQNDFMIEHEVNAPGIWMDGNSRVLQFEKDKRGYYKVAPVQLPR